MGGHQGHQLHREPVQQGGGVKGDVLLFGKVFKRCHPSDVVTVTAQSRLMKVKVEMKRISGEVPKKQKKKKVNIVCFGGGWVCWKDPLFAFFVLSFLDNF